MSNYRYRPRNLKHTIKSQTDCKILLANGYKLMNATGGIVFLQDHKQVVVQQRVNIVGKKHYNFSNPQCWAVLNENTGLTGPVKITFMMKFWYYVGRLF